MDDGNAAVEPVFFERNRVWRTYVGGRELDRIQGVAEPKDSHFPEEWVASTTRAINPGREHPVHEGISRVARSRLTFNDQDAPAQIQTQPDTTDLFTTLLERAPEAFLGPAHHATFGPTTQVLVKLLDSAARLNFQCHPAVPWARAHLGASAGKTEAYYILAVRPEVPDPHVFLGFQHPPTPREWREIITTQDLARMEACFEPVPVAVGDVLVVPGGFPHAIGEGILMVETMEPTDFCCRFEFQSGDYLIPEPARFFGRPVDFVLDMFDYAAHPVSEIRARFTGHPTPVSTPDITPGTGQDQTDLPRGVSESSGREELLVGPALTDKFRIHRVRVPAASTHVDPSPEAWHVVVVTRGAGKIAGGPSLGVADYFFVPYALPAVQFETSETPLEYLKVFPPTALDRKPGP